MHPLSRFDLPLQPGAPPPEFDWVEQDVSITSRTTAFNTGLDARDTFLGRRSCIVCGYNITLDYCHVIPQSEQDTWADLKQKGWVPLHSKDNPQHEPRNGLTLCRNHYSGFDEYYYFIRFIPDIHKFILINYSGRQEFDKYHGKAIALDTDHRHALFPALFIIHEMRVRGHHPFQDVTPLVPDQIVWQDWISERGIIDHSGAFIRDPPSTSPTSRPQPQHMWPGTGGSTSDHHGRILAPLTDGLIAEILAATRALPSWRACEMEGMSWEGTADENARKYISTIGLQHDF